MISATSTPRVRHSDTRDRILEYLRSTKAHPSAETIYNALKPTMPTLSLKTVYTNLNFFEEHGQAIRVANVNGVERYDANCEDHVHFVCDECGTVIDIMDADIKKAKKACQVGQAKIKSIQIVLHGTCESCSV
ncbi:MAG: transcriptional repressor [Clostridia bacterium]|nr:transcriptional repressor [Clostridia bacterium]